MKKVKVAELQGAALDYAVAVVEGFTNFRQEGGYLKLDFPPWPDEDGKVVRTTYLSNLNYSEDWDLAGQIIDSEEISIDYRDNETQARVWFNGSFVEARAEKRRGLLAAMRCYVALKLGDEIEIPEELIHD